MSDTEGTVDTVEPVDDGGASNEGTDQPTQLADDHPLVKTLAAQKEQIKALKERTQLLDEIEESRKSESEKAAERLTQAEARATEAEARASRRDVALEFSLSSGDAQLLDTIDDGDAMRKLAERLSVAAVERRTQGNVVPREGNNPHPPEDPLSDFAKGLFGRA